MAIMLPPIDHTPETWPQGIRQGPPRWPDAPAGTGEMPEFPERAPERKVDLFLAFVDGLSLPLSTMRLTIHSMTLMPDLDELGAPLIDDVRQMILGRLASLQSKIETGRTYCEGADLISLRDAIVALADRGIPRGLIPPEARALIGDLEEAERPTGVDTDFRYRPRVPEHLPFWKTVEPWTFARVFWDDLSAWFSDPASYEGELAFTECIEQNAVGAALAVLYAMDPRLSPERKRCEFMLSVFYPEPEMREVDQPDAPTEVKPIIDPTTLDFPPFGTLT